MPGVREYFKTDFNAFRFESNWQVTLRGHAHNVEVSVIYDLTANAKYIAMYFSSEITDGKVIYDTVRKYEQFFNMADTVVLGHGFPDHAQGTLEPDGNVLRFTYELLGDRRRIRGDDTSFTRRVFVYTENIVPDRVRAELQSRAQSHGGLQLVFRDRAYAAERDRLDQPRAFVSHDSRDMDTIARPIATQLKSMGCPVWYSEFSLTVGESLRESIERGLKVCHQCIFILSPNFLSKGGWPKREYQAIFTRELIEGRNLILPVWAGVSEQEVFEYSPVLADRYALDWERGLEEVCRQLFIKLIPD